MGTHFQVRGCCSIVMWAKWESLRFTIFTISSTPRISRNIKEWLPRKKIPKSCEHRNIDKQKLEGMVDAKFSNEYFALLGSEIEDIINRSFQDVTNEMIKSVNESFKQPDYTQNIHKSRSQSL